MRGKILIIDDDDKLRKLLGEYLADYDYEIEELPDGNSAAEAVWKMQPSVIVLDVMMPGKDGFEVLSDIRRVSAVPVIMLTAKGDASDRVVGLEMGADGPSTCVNFWPASGLQHGGMLSDRYQWMLWKLPDCRLIFPGRFLPWIHLNMI